MCIERERERYMYHMHLSMYMYHVYGTYRTREMKKRCAAFVE